MSKRTKEENSTTKEVREEIMVNGAKITIIIDDIDKLKRGVMSEKYVNRLAMKLDLTSVNKLYDVQVPFYLKFENRNVEAKNPKGSSKSEKVY